jgi:anti-sigma-K factor RskA
MSADDPRRGANGCDGNAAPYVLGALTDAETEEFRRHLETCAVCREEVAALQVVAAALPAAAPQVRAPVELKRRVMSAAREEARRDREREGRRATRRPSLLGLPAIRLGPALAGLAIATLIALTVIAFTSGGGGTGVRVVRAEVHAAHASAVVRLSASRGVLTVAGMPQTEPGRVYEVWLKGAGPPRPTDVLFTVTSGGSATVGLPGSLAAVKAVLVTSEPRGGSRVPTREPVIIARLS